MFESVYKIIVSKMKNVYLFILKYYINQILTSLS